MIVKRIMAWGLIVMLLVSLVPVAFAQDDTQGDTPAVGLELVVDGLTAPLGLMPAGDDSGRHFIFEQVGQIWVLDENGDLLDTPFLDLTDRMVELNADYDERGLLGLAFHPDYAGNGRFFVYYSAPLSEDAPAGWNHTSHVSEFTVSADDPNVADPGSERIILQVDQPQGNHNGGQIAFGPDGYLYIPLGDGGAADDVAEGHTPDLGNAQDVTNVLGSILRIDVDGEEPYGIPADNPFADDEEIPDETYAYGFRNPYRISFDAGGDNDLYVGDAGQNQWEEVSVVEAGGNYGWNIKEGTHCFDAENPDAQVEECPDTGAMGENLIDPVIEYQNANVAGGLGVVVVGGNVYRGSAIPELEGRYIFGDWSTGWDAPDGHLLVATPGDTDGELWDFDEFEIATSDDGTLGYYLLSFGQDEDLELYVMVSETAGPSGDAGAVYKIVPAGDAAAEGVADTDEDTDDVTAQATVTPTITVEDQAVEDGMVTVASVTSDGPGWLVIHADDNGAPGEVLGYTALEDGENMDVVVDIDTDLATETLHAMLHSDLGVEGTYEFPGDDAPVQFEGETVHAAFTVTGLDVEAQPEVAAQPTVTATVETTPTTTVTATEETTPTVGTDEEEPGTLPVTGGPTTPWTSILLVAGGLAALAGGAYLLRRRQTEDVRIDK
jgi:glucose/arabinose dehydrogenase